MCCTSRLLILSASRYDIIKLVFSQMSICGNRLTPNKWVPPARTDNDLNDPDSDQNPAQTGHAQAVIIRFWSVFYQILPHRHGITKFD